MNRLWHQIFGTGFVKTVEDFGVQGEFPSHPELLDYLACEFRDGEPGSNGTGWSTKHILRLIVTSATYRQASTVRTDLASKDPDNRLFGRFPRQRLTAEEIRDQALSAAGLSSTRLGGLRVSLSAAGHVGGASQRGEQHQGLQAWAWRVAHRRSLYTFGKQRAHPP